MIPNPDRWRVNAYAVGLALTAPDDVMPVLVEAFMDAEQVVSRNCAMDTPAERSMHAAWLSFRARQALLVDGNDEAARWLQHAADLLVDDWGLAALDDLAHGKHNAATT